MPLERFHSVAPVIGALTIQVWLLSRCRKRVCCRREEAKELRLLSEMNHLLLALRYVQKVFHEESDILAEGGFYKDG